jgi:hypothetical protein
MVGRCMLVPNEAPLKRDWSQRLKQTYGTPLSRYAFNFNLRRYIKEAGRKHNKHDKKTLQAQMKALSTQIGALTAQLQTQLALAQVSDPGLEEFGATLIMRLDAP